MNTLGKKIGLGYAAVLVALLLAISTTLWQLGKSTAISNRVTELRAPTSRASLTVLNGINRSLAALRGWMILGKERFKEQRRRAWSQEIKPSLLQLADLSKNWTDPKNVERLRAIQEHVKKFEDFQDKIEDIARSDANTPALELLTDQGVPLALTIAKAVTEIIDLEKAEVASEERKRLLANMADFRGSMALGLASLRAFLLTGDEKSAKEFTKNWDKNQTSFDKLAADSQMLTPAQGRTFRSLIKAREKFSSLPPAILKVRRSEKWNLANNWLEQNAAPAAGEIVVLLEEMVESQDRLMRNDLVQGERQLDHLRTVEWSLLVFCAISCVSLGVIITRGILTEVGGEPSAIARLTELVAKGELDVQFDQDGRDATGILASVKAMVDSLKRNRDEQERQDWLKTGIGRLNDVMRGEKGMATLCNEVISEVTSYLNAQVGTFYLMNGKSEATPALQLMASYAYKRRKSLSNEFKTGEGLVGQAALEKQQILVRNVPDDYIKVVSGLGEIVPTCIAVTPCMHEDRVKGVVEIGSLELMTDVQLEYLDQAMPAIAINLQASESGDQVAKALAESQSLAEELQSQQDELKATNEELEEQTQLLQQSGEKLKAQQEELRVANEELEEKNDSLETQKQEVQKANRDLERTRSEIEEKAEDLAIASKYKSEFLANMSHELRTPLNSLLLLSRMFVDNKEGNLTEDQMDSAGIINKSGNDLLTLINDILDLSKIEAGQMEVDCEEVPVEELVTAIKSGFQHMVEEKGLSLEISTSADAPVTLFQDRRRLEQILKNLMSNAIKFTEKGGITVEIGQPSKDVNGLEARNAVAISVADTGIGISSDDQRTIFEAFQQAEGGTARKYGGTGLGLSISKELAGLLGGEIQLKSSAGVGSTFTVYLPVRATDRHQKPSDSPDGDAAQAVADQEEPKPPMVDSIPDDRDSLKDGDNVILVIEDDASFAQLLLRECHEKGFKCLASSTGEGGLELAEEFLPAAIILDIRLPGMSGWDVLDALKESSAVRHIPVHMMSVEDPTIEALQKGAAGYLTKPASKEDLDEAFNRLEDIFERGMKDLLIVEDNDGLRRSIASLIGNSDVQISEATTGKEAIQALRSRHFDCMILDLGLPDVSGFELLEQLEGFEDITVPPVIVNTGKELSREEESKLRKYSDSVIIKGVKSDERLLDEVSLFLHQEVDKLPDRKQKMITDLHDADAMFKDKQILLVDDDMRNVFALSKILQEKGMQVIKAEDGQKALDLLSERTGVDLVLMDIMMPVMDGYETMERIRAQDQFRKLPIIALTAKAMKEDQRRCIEAGANDYLAKPVDVTRLASMMRVWLYR